MISGVFWQNTSRIRFRKSQSMQALHVLTVTVARDLEGVLTAITRLSTQTIADREVCETAA